MSDSRPDLIIRNASIYDGSGAPPAIADVAIRANRIAAVGAIRETAPSEIDAKGLALAPGFIDVHSHDDFAVLLTPEMDFKVMQGVTTDIVGNCGFGVAPYDAGVRMLGGLVGASRVPKWQGHRGYLEVLDRDPASLNVAVLAGHNTIRFSAMGVADRTPSAGELAAMRESVREGIDAGAVGFSTGLIYEPGRYARTEEVIELAREMTGSGALYATHMRSEAGGLLDSIRETIRIGAEADVPVQISHHKASGRENRGKVRESLALIDRARAGGQDVTADQYPYTSGSTMLFALVQNGAFDENPESGVGRLEPEMVLMASVPGHPEWEGLNLAQIGAQVGLSTKAIAERIVAEAGRGAIAILNSMNEDDVRTVMRHPTTMIGSDGIAAGSRPHPRLYGTFPRVLGRYARDGGLMPMEQAIHRMTGMPAAKFHLADRGAIRAGAFADLVLFDPAKIIDVGTYDDPKRYPLGIRDVFVNGVAVVRDVRHTGARPGRAIRRG